MKRQLSMFLTFIAPFYLSLSVRAHEARGTTIMDTAAFATDLYAHVGKRNGNLFFSPTSIETALAMTYVGAKGGTADQMAKTLHLSGSAEQVGASFGSLLKTLNNPPEVIGSFDENRKPVKEPAYQLIVANALWGQQGSFAPSYTNLIKNDFAGGLNPVDYHQPESARKTINDWVAGQTKDKIKDLIAPGVLTPATRLVLTNAIYFKSNWESKFQKSATKDGPFTLADGQARDVPFMHQHHDFGYMENADLQLLELPYNHRELSMVVLLPRRANGLAELEKNLTAGNLRSWLKEAGSESVEVTLPKFTFRAELELVNTLHAMGMTDAFDPDKADFSAMSAAERFFISAVIHKAFVAVDEEGTEAAAATAVIMRAGSAMQVPRPPKIFKADHPFVFLIRHNSTGEILFLGRLAEPMSE